MKYLKLFEDFGGEDPKWIITSALDPILIDDVVIDERYKDTSMFQIFGMSDIPSDDKLNHLESWLEEEGYYSTIKNNKVIVTEKPLKETCIDWLNENYSGMEAVDSKDYPGHVLYRYAPKNNILFYEKKNRKVWVRYDLIWSFFGKYLGLDNQEIKGITEEWLSETYNLKGITTIPTKIVIETKLSETYNLKGITTGIGGMKTIA
jgi:hypothetical protein